MTKSYRGTGSASYRPAVPHDSPYNYTTPKVRLKNGC
jgi:hypothetical protein